MQTANIDTHDIGVIVENGKDKQIVQAFDADYDRCPSCESAEIEYGEFEPESGVMAYRTHVCLECGCSWEERYDLVKVVIKR